MIWLKVVFSGSAFAISFMLIAIYGDVNFTRSTRTSAIFVSVNTTDVIFQTDHLSPSFALGASIFEYNLVRLFNDARFVALAQALGHSELRVGGTKQDFVHFKRDSEIPNKNHRSLDEFEIKEMTPAYRLRKHRVIQAARALDEKFLLNTHTYGLKSAIKPIILSETEWNKLNKFCNHTNWKLLFGLNLLIRDGHEWNSTNAEKLILYSQNLYRIDWQLGNEPNSYNHKFGMKISADQIAKDFIHLSCILRQSSWWDSSKIIGPDANRMQTSNGGAFLKRFLMSVGESVQVASFHQYYINGKYAKVADFLNVTILDSLSTVLNHVEKARKEADSNVAIWLSETSSAFGGGTEGLTDTFINGFMWLDKLGLSARSGVNLIVRQTFYWGNYALLDKDFTPRPDYWLTLLYKRLVGHKVFKLKLYSTDNRLNDVSNFRMYAHCAKNNTYNFKHGSIVFYFINIDKVHQKLKMLEKDLNVNGKLYLLQSSNSDNLRSKFVKLNGELIEMVDYSTLPQLNPTEISGYELKGGLSIPPHSFGFLALNSTISHCLF